MISNEGLLRKIQYLRRELIFGNGSDFDAEIDELEREVNRKERTMLVCDICKDRRKGVHFRLDVGHPKLEYHLDVCYGCGQKPMSEVEKAWLANAGELPDDTGPITG